MRKVWKAMAGKEWIFWSKRKFCMEAISVSNLITLIIGALKRSEQGVKKLNQLKHQVLLTSYWTSGMSPVVSLSLIVNDDVLIIRQKSADSHKVTEMSWSWMWTEEMVLVWAWSCADKDAVEHWIISIIYIKNICKLYNKTDWWLILFEYFNTCYGI